MQLHLEKGSCNKHSEIFPSVPASHWIPSVKWGLYIIGWPTHTSEPQAALIPFIFLHSSGRESLLALHSQQPFLDNANTVLNRNHPVRNIIICFHCLQQAFRLALTGLVTDGRRFVPATIRHLFGNHWCQSVLPYVQKETARIRWALVRVLVWDTYVKEVLHENKTQHRRSDVTVAHIRTNY